MKFYSDLTTNSSNWLSSIYDLAYSQNGLNSYLLEHPIGCYLYIVKILEK